MNRLLIIPAGCCLVAYAALFATLQGTYAETPTAAARSPSQSATASVPSATTTSRLTQAEAEKVLEDLKDNVLRSRRAWEESPRRAMSRARIQPKTNEPSSTEYALAASQPGEHQWLGTILVRSGPRTQTYPCVIDKVTKKVAVFGGQWISAEAWLEGEIAPIR